MVHGSNSIFSTITSAGGGGRDTSNVTPYAANAGGSGGGGGGSVSGAAGAGNTPPVSPSQGKMAVQDKMVLIQEVQVAVAQERQELMLQHHLVHLPLAELV